MRLTDVTELDVHQGSRRVGVLRRTAQGSEFRYREEFLDSAPKRALATTLPLSPRPFETQGVNLHPFFAGLLPEGLRFSALVRRVKTSEDDLFSLLCAVGHECVGDVAVTLPGEALSPYEPAVDAAKPGDADFGELLRRTLDGGDAEMGLPGVQEKLSGGMISLPVSSKAKRGSFILKLNPPDRPLLVENEHLFMTMARACGLDTAETKLLRDRNGRSGLLVTRFDRRFATGTDEPRKLHQEDACQLLGRYPADKYRLTCQQIVDRLREVCGAPLVQVLRFLELQAFNYLIGNGDFHAKNVSVLRSHSTGLLVLSPAYDVLTTHAYRGLDQRMPLKMGAKDDRLRAGDFIAFGERSGVREAAVRNMLKRLTERARPWLDRLDDVEWAKRDRDRVVRALTTRLGHLS